VLVAHIRIRVGGNNDSYRNRLLSKINGWEMGADANIPEFMAANNICSFGEEKNT